MTILNQYLYKHIDRHFNRQNIEASGPNAKKKWKSVYGKDRSTWMWWSRQPIPVLYKAWTLWLYGSVYSTSKLHLIPPFHDRMCEVATRHAVHLCEYNSFLSHGNKAFILRPWHGYPPSLCKDGNGFLPERILLTLTLKTCGTQHRCWHQHGAKLFTQWSYFKACMICSVSDLNLSFKVGTPNMVLLTNGNFKEGLLRLAYFCLPSSHSHSP